VGQYLQATSEKKMSLPLLLRNTASPLIHRCLKPLFAASGAFHAEASYARFGGASVL
jgi:hypothetical protein